MRKMDISATELIESMRQDYLIMPEGKEKEDMLQHIYVIHAKYVQLFMKDFQSFLKSGIAAPERLDKKSTL